MNRDEYARVQAVFEEAVELEGEARREYLRRACAGDATLLRNVERLLARDEDDGGVSLDGEAGLGHDLLAEAAAGSTRELAPGSGQIGRYRIDRKIAEGGMGAVYLAEQDHPRRRVALKVIRSGVITEELRRRFEFEAELLGRLQHPGIAQIYEAGEAETEEGRLPYFAMEYVDGVELRQYVERHGLGAAQRLELLAGICDAVSHAHQKGIVHRDLKPGNVLVVEETTMSAVASVPGSDLRGRPVVLDFGVSRLVREGPVEATKLTQTGHVLGTLAYMSPEQAGGELSVDTRSDVYSLGVIGYELLCGRLPHDLREARLIRALRTIQEKPAPRLDAVDPRLRGDVSIIIGKALELEPERRYSSAAALADDIRRYLGDQPITARPPTLGYQLARFVRRNRMLVASALLAVSFLAIGLVLALFAQREEARLRRVAEERTVVARRTTYAAQIQAASAFHAARDARAGRRQVSVCAPDLRGWEWEYLSGSLEDDLSSFPMTVLAHPCFASVPGEARAIFAVDDRTLRLFEFTAGTWRDFPLAEAGTVEMIAITLMPGRDTALAGDQEGNLHALELDGSRASQSVWKGDGAVHRLRFSPDLRHVAVACWGRRGFEDFESSLYVLDTDDFQVVARRAAMPRTYDVGFRPDGAELAVATGHDEVLVLDALTLERVRGLRGHEGAVLAVSFSPDGLRIASAGFDRTLRLWDAGSGRQEVLLGPVQYEAEAIEFAADGRSLISGHADARIRHWNLETGTCERLTSGGQAGEPTESTIQQLFIEEERALVHGLGLDGVHVRSLREPLPRVLRHALRLYSYVYDVEFDPAGQRLASAGWDGFVRIWDVATGRPLAVLECPEAAQWARFSPDGRRLLTSSQEGYTKHVLRLWNAATLRVERTLKYEGRRPCGVFVPRCDAFLLGADRIDRSETDFRVSRNELWVLDPITLEVREKRMTSGEVWSLVLSPDGARVAYGMSNGQLVICDAASLEPLHVIQAQAGAIEAMAYSPDGIHLATGGEDEEVRVLDTRSGREVLRFDTPGARNLLTLLYTPDGRRILTGSRRVSIGIWDADSGLEILRLHGHEDYVRALALSPDGEILASASGDGTARLWDTRSPAGRREAKDRMLATEAAVRERVERLMGELSTPDEVLAAIDAAPTLDALQKHAARNLVQLSR